MSQLAEALEEMSRGGAALTITIAERHNCLSLAPPILAGLVQVIRQFLTEKENRRPCFGCGMPLNVFPNRWALLHPVENPRKMLGLGFCSECERVFPTAEDAAEETLARLKSEMFPKMNLVRT